MHGVVGYIGAILTTWYALVSGSIFALDQVVQAISPKAKNWLDNKWSPERRRPIEVIALFVLFGFAGYEHWHKEHEARVNAEAARMRIDGDRAYWKGEAERLKGLLSAPKPLPLPTLPKSAPTKTSPSPLLSLGEAGNPRTMERQATVRALWNKWINDRDGVTSDERSGLTLPPDDWMNAQLKAMKRDYRVRARGSVFDIFDAPVER